MLREADLASHSAEEHNRRDFIVILAQAFAGVGAAAALWPFIQQMNPDASTQALASIEVDLAPVKEGRPSRCLARQAGLHPQPHAPTRSRRRSRSSWPTSRIRARNEALPEKAPAIDTNRTK